MIHARSFRIAAPLLLAALLVSCSKDSGGDGAPAEPALTPDDVLAGDVALGERVTLEGSVTSATFTTRLEGEGLEFAANDDRYVLLGVSDEVPGLSGALRQWGVAARFPAERLASRDWAIPQAGDRIRVTGTLTRVQLSGFGPEQRHVLDPVESWTTLETALVEPLGDIGDACFHDLECMDDLLCGRASLRCELPPPGLEFRSAFRNRVGFCESDDDCPNGQICDRGYAIKADGPYSAPYDRDLAIGAYLCQYPDRDAPLEELCPRFVTASDVLSGRYTHGKEVCIEGSILISIFNPGDRDTHIQYAVPDPLNYPLALPPIAPFGLAVENTPPYKDPENPKGAIPDPRSGERVVHIGTVRFDPNHNWQEVHPIKLLRVLPAVDAAPVPAAELTELGEWPGVEPDQSLD